MLLNKITHAQIFVVGPYSVDHQNEHVIVFIFGLVLLLQLQEKYPFVVFVRFKYTLKDSLIRTCNYNLYSNLLQSTETLDKYLFISVSWQLGTYHGICVNGGALISYCRTLNFQQNPIDIRIRRSLPIVKRQLV